MNPCCYFLWDFLKDTLYKNNLHTIEELQQEILATVISIGEEALATVVRNYKISDVSCRWSWMPMVHILKMFLHDCHLSRLLNKETPNTVMFAM
jgi:hypothetical protein